jgi:NAD kinase
MSVAPRVVVVHRPTELEELIERHGTRAQAAFFLSTRQRRIEEAEERHALQAAAIRTVAAAIPVAWRRGSVVRADLPRFLFEPEDLIVVVGPDGLVANVAKYLDGQPVLGINPDPGRNPGVLVPYSPDAAARVLPALADTRQVAYEERTMVEALVDDGQRLCALNEVFVGPATHQTARYTIAFPDGRSERQASSGVIVSTGTGATGWCRSAWLERHSTLELPRPTDARLAWFVREAWPSPATATGLTEGDLDQTGALYLTVESDRLVAFGDGIEPDAISLAWGQAVQIRISDKRLRLIQ